MDQLVTTKLETFQATASGALPLSSESVGSASLKLPQLSGSLPDTVGLSHSFALAPQRVPLRPSPAPASDFLEMIWQAECDENRLDPAALQLALLRRYNIQALQNPEGLEIPASQASVAEFFSNLREDLADLPGVQSVSKPEFDEERESTRVTVRFANGDRLILVADSPEGGPIQRISFVHLSPNRFGTYISIRCSSRE